MEIAMNESKGEVKVVLLGKENGGKSCLVVRYLHKRYHPRNVQSTIGAAYGTSTVQLDENRIVNLGIWDTAGSERFNAMTRVYYREAKAAVVCYDLTDSISFDRAKFWINELKKHEELCKVYLCGTKLDLIQENRQPRAVDPTITSDYAIEIDAKLFETSSKTGENVEELFYEIAKDSLKTEAEQARRRENEAILLQNRSNDTGKSLKCC
ncbi:ras-related protein Rab-24 [Exaiptasia diaphana]|uniref:Ras-related protein Rab-24 n=1 Tax=Exaiptasia diaphana TaxID=2652724 RepID=A0A913Y2X1_EXADI|nr:ras-related protein Rab-24 [Exaiptasia diaphana]KXJ22965.1 Ras-related protein Rab-24 [Exaiptasia diaphana]